MDDDLLVRFSGPQEVIATPKEVCIAKGKAHRPCEFGCKVGLAAANREGLFLAAEAFEGNPYDGHTLTATAARTEAATGVKIKRICADKAA